MQVVVVDELNPQFAEVLALARSAKQTVGFLPDSAFMDRARQGTLLATVRDGRVTAYVLYDLPRDEIKIVQLVVHPDARRGGAARQLVDELVQRHSKRRGILLHCRNDFLAHKAWPGLGFTPVGERAGRSFDGKALTRWWKSFGHPDLLTILDQADDRPVAVLDSCTFFDLVANRPGPLAEQLRADWIGDQVRLSITDEVLVEISRGKDKAERDRQRSAANWFATMSPPQAAWTLALAELRAAHPDAPVSDENDLRQIARALAAQATWLVSSDPAKRHRYRATAESLSGLRIVEPAEFIREIDELARSDWYRPIDLAGTTVTCREADAESLMQLAPRFVNHQDGETIGQLRAIIRDAASRPKSVWLQIIEVDGEPRGLASCESDVGGLRVGLARVTHGRGESVLGRQLLAKLRRDAASRHLDAVIIADRAMPSQVRRSLRDEGFISLDGDHVALSIPGLGNADDLRARTGTYTSSAYAAVALAAVLDQTNATGPTFAARVEAAFVPYRILGEGIPTFVVPIRHHWATALFDPGLAEGQLFPRDWDLGLRRELVYYRNPRNDGGLRAPARILWYVSGPPTQRGSQHIRAVSLLDEVLVGQADHLFQRFRRLGVYQQTDVRACADTDGRAMALRFSATELLPSPVSLAAYREIVTGDPHSRSVVLISPREVDEHVFVDIHRRGTP
ncbi:MAG: GNAT family N-acetyltransferase [Acidimicrobiales bacterium]